MERMLTNYENGNLKDAKTLAMRFSWDAILLALLDRDYSRNKAEATANYLKGKGSFQTACDAV